MAKAIIGHSMPKIYKEDPQWLYPRRNSWAEY